MLSRRAAGNLASRYRAVLRKCRLLNLFGSLAVAGMLLAGGTGAAQAVDWNNDSGSVSITGTEDVAVVDSTGVHPVPGSYPHGAANTLVTDVTIENGGELNLSGHNRIVSWGADGSGSYAGLGLTMNGGIINIDASSVPSGTDGNFMAKIAVNTVVIDGGEVNITGNGDMGGSFLGGYGGFILNDGTVNLENGGQIFGGGLTGTQLNGGTVNMGDNSSIKFSIKGTDTIATAADINVAGTGAQITLGGVDVLSSGNVNVAEGASLNFVQSTKNGYDGGDIAPGMGYKQVAGTFSTAGTVTLEDNSGVGADMTIGDGATLQVTGSGKIVTADDSVVTFESGSLFDVSAQSAADGNGVIQGQGKVETKQNARLRITDGKVGDTYKILDDTVAANSKNGDDTNDWNDGSLEITSSSGMLELVRNADGTYAVKAADVNSVLPGLTPSLGALVSGMYAEGKNGVDAAQAGTAFLSRVTDERYVSNAKEAVTAIESAARAGLITVPHMAWAAHNAANMAVAERTSLLRNPGSPMQTQAAADSGQTGASAGDDVKTGLGLWVMPLYQSWSADDQKGGNLKLDVDGELGGVALGGDYTFANAIRAGISFNVGGGSADGEGDFNKTSNDFTFWGVGAYAGWNPGNLGLTADVNYTRVDNDVEQDMPAALGMGSKLESDIDSHDISAGLRGDYRIETGSIDITPHAGVRYTHLRTDDYDLNSAAGTVLEGDSVSQDIWTFPVGVTLSSDFETENGWLIRPSLDLSVIPAAGDLDARGDVRFTGVNGVADVKAEVVDDVIYSGQLGLDFGNDDVKVGLDYNLQTGEDTLSHGVFATFRYEF
ncbi:MAG: autotransporter domain-containing protein [Desulfovibrionaceae bacterium]|nr:autotransporter domain-containing protein [Desulfovibrionaceae bacterium]